MFAVFREKDSQLIFILRLICQCYDIRGSEMDKYAALSVPCKFRKLKTDDNTRTHMTPQLELAESTLRFVTKHVCNVREKAKKKMKLKITCAIWD